VEALVDIVSCPRRARFVPVAVTLKSEAVADLVLVRRRSARGFLSAQEVVSKAQ
jgi:hypothetical protein